MFILLDILALFQDWFNENAYESVGSEDTYYKS